MNVRQDTHGRLFGFIGGGYAEIEPKMPREAAVMFLRHAGRWEMYKRLPMDIRPPIGVFAWCTAAEVEPIAYLAALRLGVPMV